MMPIRRSHAALVSLLLALGSSALALLSINLLASLALLSAIHIAFGAVVFLRHGGSAFTATGTYLLGSSVFAGWGGMILARGETQHTMPSVLTASGLVLLVNLATLIVSTQTRPFVWAPRISRPVRPLLFSARDSERYLVAIAGGLAASWLLAILIFPRFAYFVIRFGFAAIILAVAVLFATHPARIITKSYVRRTLAIGVMAGAYFVAGFTGGGRLVLGVLGLSLLLLCNFRSPHAFHKWTCILALVPGLVWAGYVRSGQDDLLGGATAVLASADGLGSLHSPLETLGQLLDLNEEGRLDQAPSRWGGTFITSSLFWVPRIWWPGKPDGFGRELTHVLLPHRLHTGHSMAALSHGEWLVNFGMLGFGLAVFALGWALRFLDIGLRKLHERPQPDPFMESILAVTTAHLVIYAWAGSFSFASRAGLVLLFLWLASRIFERARASLPRTEPAGPLTRHQGSPPPLARYRRASSHQ